MIMSILKVCEYPDPVLKQKAKKVPAVTDEVLTLLDNMLETMYASNGIGIAAPQVGVSQRMVVIDVEQNKEEEDKTGNPIFMINPEIIWHSEELSVYCEGCLSVPGQNAEVERPASVKVKYLDKTGKEQILAAEGLLATCIQHELDHLDGILYIDHLSRLKRNMLLKKLQKSREEKQQEE